jgi:hypothetical protein
MIIILIIITIIMCLFNRCEVLVRMPGLESQPQKTPPLMDPQTTLQVFFRSKMAILTAKIGIWFPKKPHHKH